MIQLPQVVWALACLSGALLFLIGWRGQRHSASEFSRLVSLTSARLRGEPQELFQDGVGEKNPFRRLVRSLLILCFRGPYQERAILRELPLTLESLILLVESGLGILPAIHKLIESRGEETKPDSVRHYLALVHSLSSKGMPFLNALEAVAEECPPPAIRHLLLHLDIGANVGGQIGASLRSLAQHSHLEWRLSVEARVRRLENFVVFPVFGSVIGLVLLTAAVPLIPLLELQEKLDRQGGPEILVNESLYQENP